MLEILFEDYHCIVVNKPAPLLTQAPSEVPSLEALVKEYIKHKHAKPAGVYLGVPHRLDRPVSGAIVFARNSKAARRLAEQFHNHQVDKVYWAIASGPPHPAERVLEDWLRKIPDASRTETAREGEPGAKYAALSFRTLRSIEAGTLLELRPLTGRAHQLRVQLASRGWPVVGDALYGSTQTFGPPAQAARDRVIALHARSLTFTHPTRREPVTITAPLPLYWPAEARDL